MSQAELFPEFEPGALDSLSQFPEEMRHDFSVLMGHVPMGEPLKPSTDHLNPTGQQRFLAKRAKKTEKRKRTISNPKVLVLDLATPEGRAEYEKYMVEIVPLATSDPEHWRVTQIDHPLTADRYAPAGYRLLVTLRYYQCDEEVVPGDHGFTIIPREKV
jgi:hypothetical protein